MNTTKQKATSWFDLIELVRLCPGEVPALDERRENTARKKAKKKTIAITGNARLLLFTFALHADGATDETWVSRRTLRHETQMAINTLDAAISNLKLAGLLRIRKEFIDSKGTSRHIWIIQREWLKTLVGDEIKDESIAKAVEAAIEDGSSSIRCSSARVEQVKTEIWKAAGSTRLDIAVKPTIEDQDKMTLLISQGDKDRPQVFS